MIEVACAAYLMLGVVRGAVLVVCVMGSLTTGQGKRVGPAALADLACIDLWGGGSMLKERSMR